MPIKRFVVDHYQVKLGQAMTATWGGVQVRARGVVACYGEDHRFVAYFLTDDSPVAAPVYDVGGKIGAIFLPFKELMPFVDMLRNEKPIFAYLNSESPEWNCLSTSDEPVGEQEG